MEAKGRDETGFLWPGFDAFRAEVMSWFEAEEGMMERKYSRKTDEWWRGQMVIALVDLTTERITLPAGSICKVTRKYGGLTLQGEDCIRCGVSPRISRAPYCKLDLLDNYVAIEYDKAVEQAKVRSEKTGLDHAVVLWEGRHLVLPEPLFDHPRRLACLEWQWGLDNRR